MTPASDEIDQKTRYQAAWAEINAKIIARQNAQNVSVVAVAAIMTLVLQYMDRGTFKADSVSALVVVMPALTGLVFVIWFCALDHGIALLSQMLRIYDSRASDTDEQPKWFANEQEWLDRANRLRTFPGLGQALVTAPTLLPPLVLIQRSRQSTVAWLAFVVALFALVLAASLVVWSLRFRSNTARAIGWSGKIPDGCDQT